MKKLTETLDKSVKAIADRKGKYLTFTLAGDILMRTVVDAVSEVLSVKAEDIEETPTFGTNLDTDYILGMAKVEGNVKILLDIDKVISGDEFNQKRKIRLYKHH